MKFLSKHDDSEILEKGLVYKKGDNKPLVKLLLAEQKSFCAYTEAYILPDDDDDFLESVDLEHFNAALKFTAQDNYHNYYAVLHRINIKKLDEKYANASFHASLFFHNRTELDRRIEYDLSDNFYFEKEEGDTEARDFIDFIQIDSPIVFNRRAAHLKKLETIRQAYPDNQGFINYLLTHRKDLDFITAIEKKFEIELESFL